MTEVLVRFFLGGLVVSAVALLGDILRPKSFAGLFGAAPSVALATLGMAVVQRGQSYAAVESTSMIWGAIALLLYSVVVCQLLMRLRLNALIATLAALPVWLMVAFTLHALFGGAS
jgi:uncharacterized membrane protein (GlpM family)